MADASQSAHRPVALLLQADLLQQLYHSTAACTITSSPARPAPAPATHQLTPLQQRLLRLLPRVLLAPLLIKQLLPPGQHGSIAGRHLRSRQVAAAAAGAGGCSLLSLLRLRCLLLRHLPHALLLRVHSSGR